MKMSTVVGMGSASSLIFENDVDKILGDFGVDADVGSCDLGSAKGTQQI